MRWQVEKEEKAESLNSWIEATSQEIEFAETIYKIIKKSLSKKEFIRTAKEKLQECQNPWIQEELNSILGLVIS